MGTARKPLGAALWGGARRAKAGRVNAPASRPCGLAALDTPAAGAAAACPQESNAVKAQARDFLASKRAGGIGSRGRTDIKDDTRRRGAPEAEGAGIVGRTAHTLRITKSRY